MWAMVKQSDNRSCFHTESRPITFRAHCEKKQGCYFLKNDTLTEWQRYFFHTPHGILKIDLSRLFYYPRSYFRAEARRLRRERGEDQMGVVAFFKEWQRYFSHTPRGILKKKTCHLFLQPAYSFSRRGYAENAERIKGELLLFKEWWRYFFHTPRGMLENRLITSAFSAWKNRDVTIWKTIPLQSDNSISPTQYETQKIDLSSLFYHPRFNFRAEAQRLRKERSVG